MFANSLGNWMRSPVCASVASLAAAATTSVLLLQKDVDADTTIITVESTRRLWNSTTRITIEATNAPAKPFTPPAKTDVEKCNNTDSRDGDLQAAAAAATTAAAGAEPPHASTSSMPSYPPQGLSGAARRFPRWIQLGCGDQHYHCPERGAVFPAHDCPDEMPNLQHHDNYCANYLREHPDVYHKYKHAQSTPAGGAAAGGRGGGGGGGGGVPFAACIKPGMDNPRHPRIKTVGLVAGDEACLTTFSDVFEPVTAARHGGWPKNAVHPAPDLNDEHISTTRIDPSCDGDGNCDFVLTARIRTGRSLRGFRLPPACSFEERREIERVATSALLNLRRRRHAEETKDHKHKQAQPRASSATHSSEAIDASCDEEEDFAGDYFPLSGSRSFAAKPEGMTEQEAADLKRRHNLFPQPTSTLLLSSGCGRHWPDARGVFSNKNNDFFVWVNEEDHLRIISMQKGDDVRAIFKRFARGLKVVEESFAAEGHEFMWHEHYGWVLTCPSNMGTGLRAGVHLRIPLLSSRPDFNEILRRMRLQARGVAGVDDAESNEEGVVDISNADRLGKSETELVNIFIEGAAQVVRWEKMLAAGMPIDHLLPRELHGFQC